MGRPPPRFDTIWLPFICHSATKPLACCSKTSLRPSPLKSPAPAEIQPELNALRPDGAVGPGGAEGVRFTVVSLKTSFSTFEIVSDPSGPGDT